MYEKVFQLKNQPFSISPNVEHYFAAKSFHVALSQCKLAIERGSGPSIVIGGAGMGKTLLLLMLAEDYQQQYRVAQFACSKLDNRLDLLRSLMFSLKQPFRDMAEGELRLAFWEYLQNHEDCPQGVLLLIDDAHWLNAGILDEIRMLSGISIAGQARCRVVMTGNHCLEEALADPQNDSLNQRIAARALLSPLNSRETEEYVREHLRRAGAGQREFFTPGALQRIHGLTHGIPRMINQICDAALLACSLHRKTVVDEALLLKAWQEIEQFPTNWSDSLSPSVAASNNSNSGAGESAFIEFGSLTDAAPSAQPAVPKTPVTAANNEPAIFADHAEALARHCVTVEGNEPAIVAMEPYEATNDSDEATSSIPLAAWRETSFGNVGDSGWSSASHAQPMPTEAHAGNPQATPVKAKKNNPFAERFESEEEVQTRIRSTCQFLNQTAIGLGKSEVEQALADIPTIIYGNDSSSAHASVASDWESGESHLLLQFQDAPTWPSSESQIIFPESTDSIHAITDDLHDFVASPSFSSADPLIESVEITTTTTTAATNEPEDDRDIVMITRPANVQVATMASARSSGEAEIPDDLAIVEKGKGRAIRMDYQQLFQQLRQCETP